MATVPHIGFDRNRLLAPEAVAFRAESPRLIA